MTILSDGRLRAALLLGATLAPAMASAHPHVWMTVRSEIVYAETGGVRAVRHRWTFDDMFAAQAVQGFDTDADGKLSPEELAPVAEMHIRSLAAFDYFTFASVDGQSLEFDKPVDYRLDQDDGALTLHFTLPVRSRTAAAKRLDVDVYDPSYFVHFTPADREPAALVGAPPACGLEVERLQAAGLAESGRLSEAFFANLSRMSGFGAQFATRIAVRCGPLLP